MRKLCCSSTDFYEDVNANKTRNNQINLLNVRSSILHTTVGRSTTSDPLDDLMGSLCLII